MITRSDAERLIESLNAWKESSNAQVGARTENHQDPPICAQVHFRRQCGAIVPDCDLCTRAPGT